MCLYLHYTLCQTHKNLKAAVTTNTLKVGWWSLACVCKPLGCYICIPILLPDHKMRQNKKESLGKVNYRVHGSLVYSLYRHKAYLKKLRSSRGEEIGQSVKLEL